MKPNTTALQSLEAFKEANFGKRGTADRDALEEGYETFKIGALLSTARKARGMTQEQLANKVGTTKSYISKIENNVKEARLSTLSKIVEQGLGGSLQLTIQL